jgi:mannan endo-1,4-beta-mannosidase
MIKGAMFKTAARAATLILALTMSSGTEASPGFVQTFGTMFTLADKPFYITGVNNHYLTYGTEGEVLRVLDDSVALGATVVRTFLQPVIGSLDQRVPTIWNWKNTADSSNLGVHGTYLLYWDAASGQMAINDGPNGMQKVDFLVAEAKKRGLHLIIDFLDFWPYTGGAQQIQAWYGSPDKNTFFFTDPHTKNDYKNWVGYVLERVNPITKVRYKDEPSIMAWELINEGNAEPLQLRRAWVAEMSAYIKAKDANHLIGSGNANIRASELSSDLTVPTIDFGTWHGYPKYSGLTASEFDEVIPRYCESAAVFGKPVLLEEFGYARSNHDQADAYAKWLDTLAHSHCAGWLVWRLVSPQDSGEYPVDEYDQFDVRNDGGPLWNVLKTATQRAAERSS